MSSVRILAGLVLLVVPAWWLLTTMVPVPRYRVGGLADFWPAIRACLALYGGAAAGLVFVLMTGSRPISARTVFRACFAGSMLVVILAVVVAGGGNLIGLIVIFGAAFSAIIALGVRFIWQSRQSVTNPTQQTR